MNEFERKVNGKYTQKVSTRWTSWVEKLAGRQAGSGEEGRLDMGAGPGHADGSGQGHDAKHVARMQTHARKKFIRDCGWDDMRLLARSVSARVVSAQGSGASSRGRVRRGGQGPTGA